MKKTIKTFVGRLRDAWAIIRGRNQLLVRYDEDTSMQDAYRTSCALMGVRWLRNSNNVDFNSRFSMLDDLLNDTNRGLQGIVGYCKQNENNNRSL